MDEVFILETSDSSSLMRPRRVRMIVFLRWADGFMVDVVVSMVGGNS